MIYITFAIMLVLLIYTLYKNKWLVSTYLIGVYTFSLFFSIRLIDLKYIYADYYSLGGSIVFIILLLLYFYPYMRKKPMIIHNSSDEFLERFLRIGYLFSIILILGMILLAPYVFSSISYGLANIREMMYTSGSVEKTYGLFGHIGHSTLRWLGWLGYINMIMFFYALVYIPRKYIFKILTIVSSFSSVWIGILNGGRTYVIYWILFFFFCIAVFYKEFSFKRKKQVFIVLIIVIAILGEYFVYITTSRISIGAAGKNPGSFLINYIGMSYWNFNYFFDHCQWHPYSLSRILPLSSNFIIGRFDLAEYRLLIMRHTGLDIGTFFTFMGDIYIDVGIIGLFIYSFSYFFITLKLMKNSSFRFAHLIYLSILIQIPLTGLFYYSYYQMETTFSIIVSLIIARYLDIDRKNIIIKF